MQKLATDCENDSQILSEVKQMSYQAFNLTRVLADTQKASVYIENAGEMRRVIEGCKRLSFDEIT